MNGKREMGSLVSESHHPLSLSLTSVPVSFVVVVVVVLPPADLLLLFVAVFLSLHSLDSKTRSHRLSPAAPLASGQTGAHTHALVRPLMLLLLLLSFPFPE